METENLVVIKEGTDKFNILDEAVTEAGLYESIEDSLKKSGKSREEFLIAVKPNFMVLTAAADLSCYTDTEMVVHLLRSFYERGFRNLYVVETENVLSQWYENRSVSFVAKCAGYKEEFYTVENLTRNAVPYHFNGALKNHFVGRVWKDADFRMSFAKNKTHPSGTYTLTLKNIFGVMVKQNKYLDYHKHMEWDWCVVDMLESFPLHFGVVDAVVSADGPFGFRGSKIPKMTNTVIAGRDCIAVDWVGAKKMGMDPMRGRLMKKVVKKWGKPSYSVSGSEKRYANWRNTPFYLPPFDDILEEWYAAHSFFTHAVMLPPDAVFPERHAALHKFIRFILRIRYPKKT